MITVVVHNLSVVGEFIYAVNQNIYYLYIIIRILKKITELLNDFILLELPNNTCVYEYEWIASIEGGERKRSEIEKTVVLKQVNFQVNINVKDFT